MLTCKLDTKFIIFQYLRNLNYSQLGNITTDLTPLNAHNDYYINPHYPLPGLLGT